MASALKKIGFLFSLFVPSGVDVFKQWRKDRAASSAEIVGLLKANRDLANRHQGERCFILGNGPSAKKLDLSKLKGETVFSVSNGYLFPGYGEFSPRYHCVPQITYGLMTEEDTVRWFNEMHEGLGNAELFLSSNEAALVRNQHLFPGRNVRYLSLSGSFDEWPDEDLVDISKAVPAVYSVPVMVLMIALYMGFKEIILLGVDHDQFLTSRYDYAFDLKIQKGKDITLNKDGSSSFSRYEEFRGLFRLWHQYRSIDKIARKNGVKIFNSTPGGALDEFPRKDFNEWFAVK
ncbi:Protein containing DUF115 (plasmid) [Neorhizobium galegae bv. officinalis bv. officinalis str. HAMBI 1141]|uniref:Protein containing DUF115 n=1 Tax=Neorhizobium galegae bv. officinalis bv. officinalis str. HAMBI 1141 TaxID=1028801 RepID=A0A068TFY3_NEOGA|nr:hypothetical protein [Neorhizobium galegae]CDN57298.1 Protein containing DUF115 [Neorhizobium galegae bv. officinalis bv. officinalis str. HAMBI 1141]